MVTIILVVLLVLLLIGSLPVYPYSANWGPWPAGGVGLLIVILLVFALLGGRL